MNRELAVYLRIQASVTAAFSFFIGGIDVALIYHKADFVPADAISIAIDITITCLLTFAITTPFCRASLRRDGTSARYPVAWRSVFSWILTTRSAGMRFPLTLHG